MRILVVDDTKFMRVELRQILEEMGYREFAEAANGADAVLMQQQFKADLIFMDISMPHMNGITAIRLIKAMDANVKIIVCSAIFQEQTIIAALKAGADEYLVKPIMPAKVQKLVKKLVTRDNHRSEREI